MKVTTSSAQKSYQPFVSLAALILLQAAAGFAFAQQLPNNGAAQNPTPRTDSSSTSDTTGATPAPARRSGKKAPHRVAAPRRSSARWW